MVMLEEGRYQDIKARAEGTVDGRKGGFAQREDRYTKLERRHNLLSPRATHIKQIAYSHGFFPFGVGSKQDRRFDPGLIIVGNPQGEYDQGVAEIITDVVNAGYVDLVALDGGLGMYEKGSGMEEGDRFRFRYGGREGQSRIGGVLHRISGLWPPINFVDDPEAARELLRVQREYLRQPSDGAIAKEFYQTLVSKGAMALTNLLGLLDTRSVIRVTSVVEAALIEDLMDPITVRGQIDDKQFVVLMPQELKRKSGSYPELGVAYEV